MSTPPSAWKKQAQSYLSDLGMQFVDTAARSPEARPRSAVKNKIIAVAGKDADIRATTVAGRPLYFAVEAKTTEGGRVTKVKTFTYTGDYFGGTEP